ncbi:MAG: secretin N-terminal domain-containing protein [Gammaproteobacteria bacterium]|nr:secretin N-terminal domain-containing protein [Gammaproteobacteria bacterium]
MSQFYRALIVCMSFLFFLVGCQSPVFNQAGSNTADAKFKMAEAKQQMAKKLTPISPLVVNQGLYIDKRPINLMNDPAWLKNRIVLRGDQLPFSYYSRAIAAGASRDLLTTFQNGLDDRLKVSINYSGTVKGALELLASKTGYIYNVRGKEIYWQAFVTKTFDIAFMPGTSDYQMGKASGGGSNAGTTSSSASSGSSGGSTVTAIIDDSAGSQYNSLKGTLSIWSDLTNSIHQMLSSDGKVVVSQSTTSVTVSDRPRNVKLIGQFIENLNNNLSKQVLVKIEVLTVQLENNFNFGINWNLVQRAIGNGTYQLISNNGAPFALSSVIGLATGSATAVGLNNSNLTADGAAANQTTGIMALATALEVQGKVSVVTQPQVLCQNNQVSSIRILDQQGYLASVQQTSTGTTPSGNASVTSQVTPGQVLTGLTLYVLPKILGNKVYLQVNADLSDNLGFKTISSTGATITDTSTAPIIQTPHITQKQFNQRSVVKSGDTLILAGFKQTNNLTGASQMLESQALGGKTAQQYSTETIVLLTPIILHGSA